MEPMKAFILIWILNGEPLPAQDYDTMALCADDLAAIKAATLAADAAAYRCIARAQFDTATAFFNKRVLEEAKRDQGP
jgi:hypothetical protein